MTSKVGVGFFSRQHNELIIGILLSQIEHRLELFKSLFPDVPAVKITTTMKLGHV